MSNTQWHEFYQIDTNLNSSIFIHCYNTGRLYIYTVFYLITFIENTHTPSGLPFSLFCSLIRSLIRLLALIEFTHRTARDIEWGKYMDVHTHVASLAKPIILCGKCVFSQWLEYLIQFCATVYCSAKVFQLTTWMYNTYCIWWAYHLCVRRRNIVRDQMNLRSHLWRMFIS